MVVAIVLVVLGLGMLGAVRAERLTIQLRGLGVFLLVVGLIDVVFSL